MKYGFYPFFAACSLALAIPATPAAAKVTSLDSNGFSVAEIAQVNASPEQIWAILSEPSLWWNPDHSFTGEAIYFSLDVEPGGCFCETIPAGKTKGGGIRHFSVIYVDEPRVLRLQGGLGPLQSEAVAGTLTIAMQQKSENQTIVSMSYVVGGYIRTPMKDMSVALDQVVGEALVRLKASAEGGDPDKAAYVARPLSDATNVPEAPREAVPQSAESGQETASEKASETVPDGKTEDNQPETEADIKQVVPTPSPAPVQPSGRLDLLLQDENDVELAGAEDDRQESEAEVDEAPDTPEEPDTPMILSGGSR